MIRSLQLLRKLTTDYSLDCTIKLISRKRHCTSVNVSFRTLVHDVEPIDDDGTGGHFHSAVLK